MVASVEGNGDFRPAKRFNRVPEPRVDIAIAHLMLCLQDRALEPPKMILTTRCSSWKVLGDLLPCWSSSSRLGERFRRPRPRELLELPGLSRSSSLGRLGSSGATLLERA